MPTLVASYEIMLNGSLKRSVLKTYENAIGDPTQKTERFLSNTVFCKTSLCPVYRARIGSISRAVERLAKLL